MADPPEPTYWFLYNDQPHGPLGLGELVQLWRDGIVANATPVCRQDGPEQWQPWHPFAQYEELVAAVEQPAGRKRTELGRAASGLPSCCSLLLAARPGLAAPRP